MSTRQNKTTLKGTEMKTNRKALETKEHTVGGTLEFGSIEDGTYSYIDFSALSDCEDVYTFTRDDVEDDGKGSADIDAIVGALPEKGREDLIERMLEQAREKQSKYEDDAYEAACDHECDRHRDARYGI